MIFYIKLAWRNIFRNKRRTIIASIAIGIGLASLIFFDAMMEGMFDNMIKSATSSLLGQAQIHHKDFRLTQEVEKTVARHEEVLNELEKEDRVESFAPRAVSFAMITSPADVSSIMLFGIQPQMERKISEIDDRIRDGRYLDETHPGDIVIGSKLAETLDVSLGDRVVVTVAQAHSGDLSQEMFRISGIYHFDLKEMDTGIAFIHLAKAQHMLGLHGQIHEIAIKFKDIAFTMEENSPFWKRFSQYDNEAVSWTSLMPELKKVLDMRDLSMFIMAVILFGIVTFGIINTLFMSLYERMFEFGVLRAVGTRPAGVRKLILFEAAALAVLSIILGVVLGFVVTYIFTIVGIDYRGIEFAGSVMTELLFPVMEWRPYILYPLSVFLFTVVVGLYPALVAGKMSITKAMRKSL